jgi:MFS superfamily sulfate permease-like transporter
VIPTPVVKGIQVGAGLSLVISAGTSLLQPLGWSQPSAADNLPWAIFAFLSLLLTQGSPRVPYALLIFLLGLLLSFTLAGSANLPSFQLWRPHFILPSWPAFRTGALDAGLGQIPLTTLNSIIAVHHLSADLLPHLPTPSVSSIGLSVAIMNLIGGWFGAMPVCHGSGGLAAQFRFGARSGASVMLLGLFKILLGICFGESLVQLLRAYPKSLLGIMVLAAGLELAKVGESLNHGARDLDLGDESTSPEQQQQRELGEKERKERWNVMFMTVGGLLAFRNDGVGFVAGMLCHWSYRYLPLRAGSFTTCSFTTCGFTTCSFTTWRRRRGEEQVGLLVDDE